MDINTVRIAVTLASFAIFIGIVLWAWSGANRQNFEEAAQLPFEEDDEIGEAGGRRLGDKEGSNE